MSKPLEEMERLSPSALTGRICNLLDSTLFCATAETMAKFAEEEFILEKEVGSENTPPHGKIQLPTKVSVVSYFYEPYLFILSLFGDVGNAHPEDYVLKNQLNDMADIPVSSTSLAHKQVCNCERIFTRYPLWGRTPEQYDLMIDSHLEAFARLYLTVKDCHVKCEYLKNIRNAFVDYKS